MGRFEEAMDKAIEIYLESSFALLNELNEKKQLRVISSYPTIDGLSCELEKANGFFRLKADSIIRSAVSPVTYQKIGYGYFAPFHLTDNNNIYTVRNGVSKLNIKIGQNFKTKAEVWELESNFDSTHAYFRAIIPIKGYYKLPAAYIQSNPFKIGDSFRVAGLVNLNLQISQIYFYDYDYDNKRYFFVDSKSKLTYAEFEKVVESIIYSYGLVCGYVARDEIYLLKSSSATFEDISGVQFRKLEGSLTGLESISPKNHKYSDPSLAKTEYLPEAVFTNLVQQNLVDIRLLRAIKIITESYEYPSEIRAATYSVALETIKNIIIEKNAEKLNPFKDKKVASQTISKLKGIVEQIDSSSFNSKDAVLKKLEQLNQVGNTDSFLKVFDLLSIELNEDDKRCIGKRNDFLHGRIPFENESEDSKSKEIKHVVFKLHLLLCAAIFKYVGFSGFLLNNLKFADEIQLKKGVEEPFFRKI